MIRRHFHTSTHRGKAQLSLLINFASRVPAIVGLLFFVPLIHRELGDVAYGQLMAAMALGGFGSVLFGGGNNLARRRIGEAMHEDDYEREAFAFQTLLRASGSAAVVGTLMGATYALSQSWSPALIVIALLPILNNLTGAFDEARAAYNEHYFTAATQAVLQTVAYAIGLTVAWVARSPTLAALVMVGPAIVASMFSGTLLLMRRPYLLHGTGKPAGRALGEGLPIGAINELVMMAVNFSVVLLQATLPPEGGAWYATIVRLFTLALTPAMLAVLPLTSYFRGIWNSRNEAVQRRITLMWIGISLAYGMLTALALWVADEVYLERAMGLQEPFSAPETLAIYVGLGAVITFKCFTGFGYMIMNTRSLNIAFGLALAFSLAAAIAGQFVSGTSAAVQWCSICFAITTPLAILWVRRNTRILMPAQG